MTDADSTVILLVEDDDVLQQLIMNSLMKPFDHEYLLVKVRAALRG